MTPIENAFAPIENDDRWANLGSSSEQDIEELERSLGRPVPADVKSLLAYTLDSEWAGKRLVQFLSYLGLRDVNLTFSEYGIPASTFAFASDGGSQLYFVDPDGSFGRGAGAIFSVDAGWLAREGARYVAADLPAFVTWMIAGG